MQRSPIIDLPGHDAGAVAATYALALTGLIIIAGVGFDYGRLAAMDSELQNGADEAALAGATQLDGAPDACARAAARAVDLVTNSTIVANDAHTISVSSETACDATGNVRFWQTSDHSTPATNGANAHFIEVIVASRSVDYAFTPIAGLLHGTAQAAAMAGLGSSICKVPPVFMCNPNEGSDPSFTIANYIGKGIRLTANDGGSTYGNGNFGYLQNSAGSGAEAVKEVLGRVNPPGDCVSVNSITTKPGEQVTVLDALNTRFDIYNGGITQACSSDGSLCPPSANTRKDVIHKGNTNDCSFTNGNGNGWQVAANPYLPTSVAPLSQSQINATAPMGYPRDMCHAVSPTGSCAGGRIGDGNWDRNAYFKTNSANYSAGFDITGTFGTSTPTRYQVYRYEAANAGTRLQSQNVQTGKGNGNGSGNGTAISQPYCRTPGVAVGGATADRRVISVAVVNCASQNLQNPLTPVKWVDMFLVEPSERRATSGGTLISEASDVYVEVIGATTLGGGSTAAQLIRRDVPYLVN